MLEQDELDFLREMTTALHEESEADKLVILSNIYPLYYPDIYLTSRDISYICQIPRDKIKFIEHQAIRKIKHPDRIDKFRQYSDISEHDDFCSMAD